jgi:hypothetical protein
MLIQLFRTEAVALWISHSITLFLIQNLEDLLDTADSLVVNTCLVKVTT